LRGPRKPAERGFTLIELLISISLLALLMVVLFGGLRIGTHHIASQTDRLDRTSRVALTEKFLRAQLGDARPFFVPGTHATQIFFDGRPDGIGFVNPALESITSGGLQTLSIDVARPPKGSGDSGQLVVEWHPFDGSTMTTAKAGRRAVLLDGIREARIAYFGVVGQEGAPDWHAAWKDMAVLPALIRVSIVFTDGEHMPELVVAPRLAPPPAPPQPADQQGKPPG
jgi:general secretion pathway protein J